VLITNLTHFLCVYFASLHVSSNPVLIIRRSSGESIVSIHHLYFSLPTAQVSKPQNNLQCAKNECKEAKFVRKINYGEFYILLTAQCISVQFLLITNLTQFLCVYFASLHVSSNPVLIIRRINCINTSSGICHSVCMWPSGMQVSDLHTGRPHTHRVTYTT